MVVGTTNGTSTDIDGKYSLSVGPSAKTLRFTGIGMKTKDVAIGASNVLDVVMDVDVLNLDEVVVTALGVKRSEKSLGYATQKVGGDNVSTAKEVNFINSFKVKLPVSLLLVQVTWVVRPVSYYVVFDRSAMKTNLYS